MSLDTIKNIAKDLGNEDLIAAIGSVEESSRGNLDRISSLERDLQKSIEKRDRQASMVKSTFGLDEITEDSLKSFSEKSGSGNADAVLKAENDKLVQMTEMLTLERDTLNSKYGETVNRYKIEKNLMSLGAAEDTENARAYDILLSEVTQGADFDEDGNLIFKAKDGTTVRNADGSPMSLTDKYAQVKDSDDFQFLFKSKRSKAGSGSSGNKSGGGAKPTSLKGMNDVERTRLYKQDPELFKALLHKK